jgi:hypothetical protein
MSHTVGGSFSLLDVHQLDITPTNPALALGAVSRGSESDGGF